MASCLDRRLLYLTSLGYQSKKLLNLFELNKLNYPSCFALSRKEFTSIGNFEAVRLTLHIQMAIIPDPLKQPPSSSVIASVESFPLIYPERPPVRRVELSRIILISMELLFGYLPSVSVEYQQPRLFIFGSVNQTLLSIIIIIVRCPKLLQKRFGEKF